ncbi:hypothetical protein NXS19_012085 [Fusarium pseudograminearum]|nr:hypothetical protein NXS19_012085 [Fusarium pseudograminearum]
MHLQPAVNRGQPTRHIHAPSCTPTVSALYRSPWPPPQSSANHNQNQHILRLIAARLFNWRIRGSGASISKNSRETIERHITLGSVILTGCINTINPIKIPQKLCLVFLEGQALHLK